MCGFGTSGKKNRKAVESDAVVTSLSAEHYHSMNFIAKDKTEQVDLSPLPQHLFCFLKRDETGSNVKSGL